MHACASTGFNCAPQILYSDNDGESKAFIDTSINSNIILNKLLSPHILRSFICTPVTWISCGFEHCMVLTVFGTVASWGYGASGCLGHGNYISYTQPKLITIGDFHGKFISYIESGGYHNSAIDESG
jgi:alpha-tubulin suppressor-like RCC1 family protein